MKARAGLSSWQTAGWSIVDHFKRTEGLFGPTSPALYSFEIVMGFVFTTAGAQLMVDTWKRSDSGELIWSFAAFLIGFALLAVGCHGMWGKQR